MSNPEGHVIVIGGGLAGCEAAWQLLRRGVRVRLYEMKPQRFSPAHTSPRLAELVCSNSLRSNEITNAVGLLKEELRRLGSLIMEAADATCVPAGRALAVDRILFSSFIEQKLTAMPGFELVREECEAIPAHPVVILATGPLTSDALAHDILELTGENYLSFYDAISPIVEKDTIDFTRVFRGSRYDEGEGDYLNCPMNREAFEAFHAALRTGEEVPLHGFEDPRFFEGCLPIEIMAARGVQTLLFGPMKPVGLTDPRTKEQPYAVVQLRKENRAETLFNMVGFQTKLTWPEQKRIFRLIPGLEKAEFARFGSIHRNTFINAPALLEKTLQFRCREGLFLAGQIAGVEGYVESTAMGLLAGIHAARRLTGFEIITPPDTTALGALVNHIANADQKTFQPMNVNFGLFPPLPGKTRKRDKGKLYAERALAAIEQWGKDLIL
jgi:methylenetetrahydrofolate--tRNA-(uracil-5-)-methyltransferase